MPTGEQHHKVEEFLEKTKWRAEAERLRALLLAAGLNEEWKWAKPTYTFDGRNVAVLITMKESIALSFFGGWALKDEKNILTRPGEHSEVARWIKFTSVDQVRKLEPTLKAYIWEAIEAERSGVAAQKPKRKPLELPAELEAALKKSAPLRKAFDGLTPGKQRAYVLFIARAKKAETREAYVKKLAPRILAGKAIDEDARAARAATAKKPTKLPAK